MAFKATTIVSNPDGDDAVAEGSASRPPPSVNPAVASGPTDFRGMLCAEFLAGEGDFPGSRSFIKEMLEKGIKVTKFSIEDVKIMDPQLASAMSQAALLDLEQYIYNIIVKYKENLTVELSF